MKKLISIIVFVVCLFAAPYAYADSHVEHRGEGIPIVDQPYISISNNHYDIHYDGNTCFQWATRELIVIVQNPIVTYDYPIGGFNILSCEEI